MSAVVALTLPIEVDLAAFVALLQQIGVPHWINEQVGQQCLWVASEQQAEQVRELFARYPQGAPLNAEPPAAVRSRSARSLLRSTPMTLALLLLSGLVFALTWSGQSLSTLRYLSFLDFQVQGDYLHFVPWSQSMEAGQWWRLWTPALLHFGFLHLAMNSLWVWELGRRIEQRQGALVFLWLLLSYALVSNVAQFIWAGPSLFGGLSGVLYGLLGHCWIYQRIAPNDHYRLPPGVVMMMLVWLLLCMTGVFEWIQFASIANAAHLSGLVAGCLSGLVGGLWAKRYNAG